MIQNLIQSVSQANNKGILVVDSHRKMVSMNRAFIDIWDFPSKIIMLQDETVALEFASSQLKNSKNFIKEIQEIYIHRESHLHDTIKFKDGRVFERISHPQYFEDEIVGRIWMFNEITEQNISYKPTTINNILFFPKLRHHKSSC